jgi:hypothetical protein
MKKINLVMLGTFLISTCFSQNNSSDRILREKGIYYLEVGNKKSKVNDEIITVKILQKTDLMILFEL